MRKPTVALFALSIGVLMARPAAASALVDSCAPGVGVDPKSIYGEQIRFEVLRNGSSVGMHSVRFERSGDDLVVRTRFDIDIDVLGVSLYRYRYAATDLWRSGCLMSMRSTIDDNGEKSAVEATREGDRLRLAGPNGAAIVSGALFPTHHWDARVVGSKQVLNTIAGRVEDVTIDDRGEEQVATADGAVVARRFVYSGGLENEVWYDVNGAWVKMRFKAKDGSTIEYLCEECGLARTAGR